MSMRNFCLFSLCLLNVVAASITLDFNVNGDETASRLFDFEDVTQTVVADVGSTAPVFTVASSSAPLRGATGSLKVTWTGKGLSGGGENAALWTFGPNTTIHSVSSGLGVKSVGDKNAKKQLAIGEAFVITFDVSSLSLRPGLSLTFSVLSDDGESYRIYQRTDIDVGIEVAAMTSSTPAVPSTPVKVDSGYQSSANIYEFAIVDPGWNGGGSLRMKSFSVDIDGEIAPTPAPTSTLPLSADTEIVLDFNTIGDERTSKTFRIANVGSASPIVVDVGSTAPCFTVNPSSENLGGASGSLTVTWTGKDRAGNLENAQAWTFGTDAIVNSALDGLGVKSVGDAGLSRQLQNGEAFVIAFNTSTLNLYPGSRLVFTVRSGANDTYRVYQRTGLNSGTIVFSMESSPLSMPTDTILVNSGYQSSPGVYEFAIADAGWNGGGGLRITQFSIGINGAPPVNTYVSPSFYPIFTDNMMLQRDANVKIYGSATPGLNVTVTFGTIQSKSVLVDISGMWSVTFDPMPASYTPQSMIISDGVQTDVVSNILVGDIWLCSGQSNMDRGFQLYPSLSTAELGNPFIRLVQVVRGGPRIPSESLALTAGLGASWQESTSFYLELFSPGAFFFASIMEANNSVPMGLIQAAMGATGIEDWMSAEALTGVGVDPNFNDTYTRNYNGMIYPLRDFTFKGVLWYQGESNVEDPAPYERLFPAMITSWRTLFGRGDTPFYFAQLAANGPKPWDLTDSAKPFLREFQKVGLTLNNTKMIVLMDAGEYLSVHPENKMAVGERFARHALIAEGHTGINVDTPTFRKKKVVGNQVIITFDNVGGGLETRGFKMNYNEGLAQGADPQAFVAPPDVLVGFQIAGSNKVFVDANATITARNKVTVSSPHVSNPVAVRYCFKWFDMCNLYASNDGWVATPFRTDNYPIPNFIGNSTGTAFKGDFASLGDPMIPSLNFGPSNISTVTIAGINGYKASGIGLRLMYFSTNNTLFQNGPRPYVLVNVLYYDQGEGLMNFRYDVGVNITDLAPLQIYFKNSLSWRVANVVLEDALFAKQLFGYDVRAQSNTTDIILGGVYLSGPS